MSFKYNATLYVQTINLLYIFTRYPLRSDTSIHRNLHPYHVPAPSLNTDRFDCWSAHDHLAHLELGLMWLTICLSVKEQRLIWTQMELRFIDNVRLTKNEVNRYQGLGKKSQLLVAVAVFWVIFLVLFIFYFLYILNLIKSSHSPFEKLDVHHTFQYNEPSGVYRS